jgi:hypothetical protein
VLMKIELVRKIPREIKKRSKENKPSKWITLQLL